MAEGGRGSGREGGGRSGVARGGQGGRAGKPGSHRKGSASGSGGQGRRRLQGRGPTPPAERRTGHPAEQRERQAGRTGVGTGRSRAARAGQDPAELIAGRNAVVEALRAKVPATALYVAAGLAADERVREAVALAGKRSVAQLEVSRHELDVLTRGALHQGLAVQVPPYRYLHPDDLLARGMGRPAPPLLVALDGVTDPRNLGTVLRSAGAFGATGVLIPQRRSAGMTAAAWKSSAGAAARVPVARATNLVRALGAYQAAGLLLLGCDADGSVSVDELAVGGDPLVVLVGSEGRGLSRLVSRACDVTVRIPMAAGSESLNAGIAAAVVLAEVARHRRRDAG